MVFGNPSAAIAASRPTPEVTPENTPTVEAGYVRAASVQKTKPMAEVAAMFTSSVSEPRYRASLKTMPNARRVCDRNLIATELLHKALTGRSRTSGCADAASAESISAIVLFAISSQLILDA